MSRLPRSVVEDEDDILNDSAKCSSSDELEESETRTDQKKTTSTWIEEFRSHAFVLDADKQYQHQDRPTYQWFCKSLNNAKIEEVAREPSVIKQIKKALKEKFNDNSDDQTNDRLEAAKKLVLGGYERSDTSTYTEDELEEAAEIFYGMIHRNYMRAQIRRSAQEDGTTELERLFCRRTWGVCPRYYCYDSAVWPVGGKALGEDHVKVKCPICNRIYISPDPNSLFIDGAFFPAEAELDELRPSKSGQTATVHNEKEAELPSKSGQTATVDNKKEAEYRVHGLRLIEGGRYPQLFSFPARHRNETVKK